MDIWELLASVSYQDISLTILPHTLPTVHSVNHQNTTRAQNQGLEEFFIVSKHNKYFHFHHRSFYILLVLADSAPAFPMPDHLKAVLRRTDAALKSLAIWMLWPQTGPRPAATTGNFMATQRLWSTLLCTTTQCGLLYSVLPHSVVYCTLFYHTVP